MRKLPIQLHLVFGTHERSDLRCRSCRCSSSWWSEPMTGSLLGPLPGSSHRAGTRCQAVSFGGHQSALDWLLSGLQELAALTKPVRVPVVLAGKLPAPQGWLCPSAGAMSQWSTMGCGRWTISTNALVCDEAGDESMGHRHARMVMCIIPLNADCGEQEDVVSAPSRTDGACPVWLCMLWQDCCLSWLVGPMSKAEPQVAGTSPRVQRASIFAAFMLC